MASVENRVVSLKFDNGNFEEKVAGVIKSLDKLSQSLAMPDAGSGLKDVSSAASNFKMDGVNAAVSGVSKGFIAMSTIAITALSSITRKAVDAGLAIGKALTITPLTDGFAEYELKMGAIQTIMAGSGENLETVNGYLNELNTYADRTIYSFADMTQNIGKFTNAGVSLEDSVAAIQGVANVAALSGANSQQASNAMYNFAQALSAGSVKLIDWKSIENAGLATVQFKDSLLEGAVAAGTLTKDADGLYQTLDGVPVDNMKNFNLTLQEGWLDAETLTTTLGKYSDETTEVGAKAAAAATDVKTLTQAMDTIKEAAGSGWAQSAELIFGNFEEGKELWTEFEGAISGVIGASADMRNQVLSDWRELGGREIVLQGIRDAMTGLATVIAPIKDAFRDLFPAKTGADLFEMSQRFGKFAKSLTIGGETADRIKRIFTGFFSVVKIGIEVVKEIGGFIRDLFQHFAGDGSGILEAAASFGDFASSMREVLVDGQGIAKFFDHLMEAIRNPKQALNELKEAFKSLFSGGEGIPGGEAASGILDRLKMRFEQLGGILEGIWDGLQKVGDAFGGLNLPSVSDMLAEVRGALSEFWGAVKDLFSGTDTEAALDIINTGLFAGIVAIFVKFSKDGLVSIFPDGIFGDTSRLFRDVGKSFREVTDVLKAMQNNIRADTLLKIALALGALTVSLVVLSLIDSVALAKALAATAIGFGQLVGAMVLLEKASSTMGAAKLVALAGGLILIAGALFLLSLSAVMLSRLSWEELAKGLLAVTVLLGVLAGAVKLISGTKGMIKAGIGIFFISAALLVLGAAMKIFATMSWEEIAKGLVTVTALLVALTVSMNRLGGMFKGLVKAGIGILLVATSMILLATAMKIFATMSWEQIAKGLAGVAGGLVAIALGMRLMPKGPSMLLQAASLIAVGIALNLIATAMALFSTMTWEEIARGLVAMAGALAVLAIAAYAMSGTILGAAAIVGMSLALGSLVVALKAASALSFTSLAKGLAVIGIALLALGLAAYALLATGATVAILALAGALFVMGLAMALFGVGAAATASAFVAIAAAGSAGIEVLIKILDVIIDKLPEFAIALAEGLLGFLQVLLDAAPPIIAALGEIFLQLLAVVVEAIPEIVAAGVILVQELLGAMRELFPDIVETGIEMLISLLEGIRENIAEITELVIEIVLEFVGAVTDNIADIVTAGADLLIAFISGIIDNIADIVAAGADLVIAFIKAIGDAAIDIIAAGAQMIADVLQGVADSAVDIVTAGADAIISFLEGMASNVLKVVDAGFQIVIDLLNGLADSIEENRGELAAAGLRVLSAIFGGITGFATDEVWPWFRALPGTVIDKIGTVFTTLGAVGKNLIAGLYNGTIGKAKEILWPWFSGIIDRIKGYFSGAYTALKSAGSNLIIGLWNGIVNKLSWLKDKILGIGGSILGWAKSAFGISSPSKEFMYIGQFIGDGLGLGLENSIPTVRRATKELSEALIDSFVVDPDTSTMQKALAQIPEAINAMDDLNPVITPVLDLTGVQKDAKALNGFFANDQLGVANNSFNQASLISATDLANRELLNDEELVSQASVMTFNQVNNSPTTLNTNDIYRNTKNQIALAKEELNIQ